MVEKAWDPPHPEGEVGWNEMGVGVRESSLLCASIFSENSKRDLQLGVGIVQKGVGHLRMGNRQKFTLTNTGKPQ